jgi:two-component system sensor histidine kinase CpxA
VKLRFPLFAKIVGWFFLNLLLVAIVLAFVFKFQFRFGLDFLLAGRAGERIQSLGELLVTDLRSADRQDWNKVLEKFSEAYHLQFYIFRNDGELVAGQSVFLPKDVRGRLAEERGPGFRRPSPDERPDSQAGLGERRPPDLRGPREMPPPPIQEANPRRPFARFLVHTPNPSRYWLVLRIPIADQFRQRPNPLALVVESETLRGGGLFLDFAPWLWAAAAVVGLSLLFWIPLVRGITTAIRQLTGATEQIAEGRFETRVPVERRDELGRLGQAINAMAGRLAGFVSGQKRFLGDIAHELCSPIARVQVALGILEQRADEKQRAYVEDVREEVQQMSSLVNELLSFSKAGLREKEIRLTPVPLEPVVRKVVERETGGSSRIVVSIPEGTTAMAEAELLTRAVANLVRNALRYGGDSGRVEISGCIDNDRVLLAVADEGPGVPEDKLQQIFDPFFRVESSRSRDTGGIGLGLAIVNTCVQGCQGTVTAQNQKPAGFRVVISLRRTI